MSMVIPKLTNYLMSLINKMKLIFYNRNSNNLVNNNQENLSESKFNYITNFFSSIFGINNNTKNENDKDNIYNISGTNNILNSVNLLGKFISIFYHKYLSLLIIVIL